MDHMVENTIETSGSQDSKTTTITIGGNEGDIDGNQRPMTWAKTYPIAVTGKRQSPINFSADVCIPLVGSESSYKPLEVEYPTTMRNLKLSNTGNGWKVEIPNELATETCLKGGPLQHRYRLEQFHCHWGRNCEKGSEHTVDGRYYAAELHFVHWNCDLFTSFKEAAKEDRGLAVIGVFLDASKQKHSELEKITSLMRNIPFKGQEMEIFKELSLYDLMPKTKSFWTYEGSLTTPPLYESVTWIVYKEPILVHENQIDQFRQLYQNCLDTVTETEPVKVVENYRPVQSLCGRQVAYIECA